MTMEKPFKPKASLFARLCTEEHLTNAWKIVKAKESSGGIDGESVVTFEAGISARIAEIALELSSGLWMPQPYLKFEIPKKRNEKRRLGLLTVKDKIVQQAIKMLIEPKCERLFLEQSYGYRQRKGAVQAIRKVASVSADYGNGWVLRLDIDDFFDNVDHGILESRLRAVTGEDQEVHRLIMLSVKMGTVSRNMKWQDVDKGLPQGAVLSPCLANLYMHSFDQFVLSRTKGYVRYADDFVIFLPDMNAAETMKSQAENYLKNRLHLSFNPAMVSKVSDGFEFLGIMVNPTELQLSVAKKRDLLEHISEIALEHNGLSRYAGKRWDGIRNYYGKILPQSELQVLDQAMYSVLERNIQEHWKNFANKNILERALAGINFITENFIVHDGAIKRQLVDIYLAKRKHLSSDADMKLANKKIIQARKREYRKREDENSEVILNRPGISLGIAKNMLTVKEKGMLKSAVPVANVKHVTLLSDGVSLSGNVLKYLIGNKIPLDIYGVQGKYIGSFISASSLQCSMWRCQMEAPKVIRNKLAALILDGKMSNQLNLVKYFHKYHKSRTSAYQPLVDALEAEVDKFKKYVSGKHYGEADFLKRIMTFEAQVALRYWDYVRSLLEDDGVGFDGRVRQGASDIVNSMLNYGYAILQSRILQALLYAQLNPYDSVIHVRQEGKPTFVFDVMEMFRPQAVDRVVFSLVQKKEPVSVKNGMLTDSSKALLVQNITERFRKREKYRGEEMSLDRILRVQAMEIADYYRDGIRFRPYKAKW